MSEKKTNKNLENQEEQELKMTPEQYDTLRREATLELKKEIMYLKVEAQYEELQADIQENKLRRMMAIARMHQLTYPQQAQAAAASEQASEEDMMAAAEEVVRSTKNPVKRKLKS